MKSVKIFGNSTGTGPKTLLIILAIQFIASILDISIIKIYYIQFNQFSDITEVIIFVTITSIILGCTSYVSYYLKQRAKTIRKDTLSLIKVSRYFSYVQVSLSVLVFAFIIQVIILKSYYILTLFLFLYLTHFSASAILILLAVKFFQWFKSDRNITLLLYAISFCLISSNILFTSFLVTGSLINGPQVVRHHIGYLSPPIEEGIPTEMLRYGYAISSVAGFILAWISTVVLLHQFSLKWKGKAHWIILTLPILYFLIQFQPLFMKIFSPIMASEPVLFGIIGVLFISYSKPIGGLIFGAALGTVTKNLSSKNIKMDSTTISAYGFVLLFISNQGLVLSSPPYPPFGIATSNALVLSCLMILIGIYSSAMSLSQNISLRSSIRKAVERKSNLLNSIAISQLTQNLGKEAIEVYNKTTREMLDEVGIASSLSAEDAREYCSKVIEELSKKDR